VSGMARGSPTWWTSDGYPRFCQFSPSECGVYSQEVALVQIACGNCGHRFRVVEEWQPRFHLPEKQNPRLSSRPDHIGWGDPPNLPCCASGPTMHSDTIRILEFWECVSPGEWARRPDIEATVFE